MEEERKTLWEWWLIWRAKQRAERDQANAAKMQGMAPSKAKEDRKGNGPDKNRSAA